MNILTYIYNAGLNDANEKIEKTHNIKKEVDSTCDNLNGKGSKWNPKYKTFQTLKIHYLSVAAATFFRNF